MKFIKKLYFIGCCRSSWFIDSCPHFTGRDVKPRGIKINQFVSMYLGEQGCEPGSSSHPLYNSRSPPFASRMETGALFPGLCAVGAIKLLLLPLCFAHHIFKCLPGPSAHFSENVTLLFVLFPIILFATVSPLKIPPHIAPSRTNYTSHYSQSVSLALLSPYPKGNVSTEWYKSLEDDGDEVGMRFQLLTRDAARLYSLQWDLNAARVGQGRKGKNCVHWALATSQHPKEGLPYVLLNSAVIAALAAVNL